MKLKKIIHTADFHIYDKHPYSIDGSRLDQIVNNIRLVIKYAIKNKVDLIYIAGDVFNNYNPSEKLLREFAKLIKYSLRGGVLIRIVVGNHDTDGEHHALESVKYLSKLSFYDNKIKIFDKGICVEEFENVNVVCVPYESGDMEKRIIEARNNKCIDKINLLFSHGTITGAKLGSGYKMGRQEISHQSLTGWDYVGFGDFHMAQQIGTNPKYLNDNKVFYSGSLNRISWTEKDEIKSFNVIEFGETVSVKKVKVPDIDMIQITVDSDQIVDWIEYVESSDGLILDDTEQFEKKIKDGFVKLLINVNYGSKVPSDKILLLKQALYSKGCKEVYLKIIKSMNVNSVNSKSDELEINVYKHCISYVPDDIKNHNRIVDYIESKFMEIE